MENNKVFYFNSYDVLTLSQVEWTQDISKHQAAYQQLKEVEVMTEDQLLNLINNNYNCWVKVVNNNPYYNNNCYLVELTLSYINKAITVYVSKEVLNTLTGEQTEEDNTTVQLIQVEAVNEYKINNDNNNKELKQTNLFWYSYRLRGFSPFCQPKSHIKHDPTIGRYGVIAYNRQLTEYELDEYELLPYNTEDMAS